MKNSLKLFASIDTLPEPISLNDLRQLVQSTENLANEICEFANFSELHYTRTSVYKGKGFEALLLCWQPGQRTPLHNHRGSACVVRVLQGVATEISYRQSNSGLLFPIISHEACAGEAIASYDQDIHQMANLNNEPLITLHFYAPALTKMELFSLSNTCHAEYDDILSRSADLKTGTISPM